MNTIIWILQILAAVLFFGAGLSKAIQPKEKLAERMTWVNDYSRGTVKLIGLAEVVGAIGLIFPVAFRILPILTPLAAIGLCLIMILAAIYHWQHNEKKIIIANAGLFLICLLVALGRF